MRKLALIFLIHGIGKCSQALAVEEFILDGLPNAVIQDTAVPANSTPLPVIQLNPNGSEVAPATEATLLAVEAELTTANTYLLSISNEDFATETTLLGVRTDLSDIEADIEAGNVLLTSIDTKLTSPLTVQATNLDIRDLSSASDSVSAVQGGTWNIADITGTVPLPTGASTEATLSTLNGKVTAVDTDDVTITASALPTGAATEATLSAMSAKLPATLGQKTGANSLAVVPASDYIPASPAVPTALTTKQAAITVGTSAVRMTTDGSAPSATRRMLNVMVDPSATGNFWYGSSSVTATSTTRGIPLFPGQNLVWMNDANDYYVISDTAAQTVFIVEIE